MPSQPRRTPGHARNPLLPHLPMVWKAHQRQWRGAGPARAVLFQAAGLLLPLVREKLSRVGGNGATPARSRLLAKPDAVAPTTSLTTPYPRAYTLGRNLQRGRGGPAGAAPIIVPCTGPPMRQSERLTSHHSRRHGHTISTASPRSIVSPASTSAGFLFATAQCEW